VTRYSIKQGNKDITGQDFRWVLASNLQNRQYPKDIVALERYEWGAFYGRLKAVKENGNIIAEGDKAWDELQARVARSNDFHDQISVIEKGEIGRINFQLEKLRLQERKLELEGKLTDAARAELAAQREVQHKKYEVLKGTLEKLNQDMERDSAIFVVADGSEKELPLSKIVAANKPNDMSVFAKLGTYAHNAWAFLTDDPREANTEGGVFPAIFGTVLMVLMMTVIVTPLGVIAAIYLREYASQGVITQTVRIAVNNLAGVPSIVYGVFGLGFLFTFWVAISTVCSILNRHQLLCLVHQV
jgi:phosphate transport system permease protein